jgi:hypothetical protein
MVKEDNDSHSAPGLNRKQRIGLGLFFAIGCPLSLALFAFYLWGFWVVLNNVPPLVAVLLVLVFIAGVRWMPDFLE